MSNADDMTPDQRKARIQAEQAASALRAHGIDAQAIAGVVLLQPAAARVLAQRLWEAQQ